MYNKNGKTKKSSFTTMNKLISTTEKFIAVLESLDIISLKGEEYSFISFDKIRDFINLIYD
jgi:hypothetical protein